jgi:hypothetical protein
LVPEPSFWRARAAQQFDEYLIFTSERLADLEREQRQPKMLSRTRARVANVVSALKIERELFTNVLAPLRTGALALPTPSAFSPAPLAGILGLLTCYEHVFRDWAWGEAESKISLEIVERLIAEVRIDLPVSRLCVFGAGAGRLAADVHQALVSEQTFALDLSPLPLLIAARLVQGETLAACEFPIAPLGEHEVAVKRRLACPFPVRAGLTFLLADALSPPFAPSSLNAVLTPWFIDAVGADPRVTAAALSRVIEPGGWWLNFGPLRFNGPTSRLYTIEEVEEIVTASGFELCARLREEVPYFASPDSGFSRRELVYGFAARKIHEASALPVPEADPAWVLDAQLPIPALEAWTGIRRSAAMAEQILALIDGQRSITDLANALGQSWNVDPNLLHGELGSYLVRFLTR